MVRGTGYLVAVTLGVIAAAFWIALSHDPAVLAGYFPPGLRQPAIWCGVPAQPILRRFEAEWYANHLLSADETSLFQASEKELVHHPKTYRFTWLRSFHKPVVVRLDQTDGGSFQLVAKRLSGKGGYDAGSVEARITRILTPQEQRRFTDGLDAAQDLNLPPVGCEHMVDGAAWIMEADEDGRYKYLHRQSPTQGPVYDLGILLLGFTGWNLDPIY